MRGMSNSWLSEERRMRADEKALRFYAITAGIILSVVLLAASMGVLR